MVIIAWAHFSTFVLNSFRCSSAVYNLQLIFVLVTIWMLLFLVSLEDTKSMISKKYLKSGLVRPQHTFLLQSISGELRPREVSSISGYCWYVALALHNLYLYVDAPTNCPVWFSEVSLSPCNILYTIISLFNAVPPEESKITIIQGWFYILPPTVCAEMSSCYLTLRWYSG